MITILINLIDTVYIHPTTFLIGVGMEATCRRIMQYTWHVCHPKRHCRCKRQTLMSKYTDLVAAAARQSPEIDFLFTL